LFFVTKTSPRRYSYFDVVVGLVCSCNPESYAGDSVDIGRASHVRLFKCDGLDKKGYPGPADLDLGMRRTRPPYKNNC